MVNVLVNELFVPAFKLYVQGTVTNVTWSFKNEFLSFLLMGIPLWHVERRMSPLSCWDPVQ